ncbi:hypothetical protein CUM95_08245 [Enterococcus faecium]|uniref:hypothetical protein n=1 Tax=Enterococcus faecium TaxID=1352 RepID=UPI000CF0D20F|nr:hypothetical protein [Enterococcus faecium]PQB69830.1 hypothetical protein CUN32_01455 [Enterococcus faecium]PQC40004.1 hypothetical protein CUM95_08245 [Enterococcus faecium]
MGDFLFAVGLIGWFLGIGIFIYSFFSKKKISRKKVIVGIISAFAAMVCGVTISPPDTEQATTHSTIQSTTTSSTTEDTSSESREKEEQKVKEIAKKKKQAQLEAKKKAEEQKQAEIAQKTSSAETILAQAEANPTRDNYDSALSAIQAIPGGNQSLSNRLANVDSAIKANEAAQAEAAKIAEQQRQQAIAQEQARQAAVQAEQQRQAQLAQEQAVAQAQQQNNQETVLITPTGKKYHNHVCGNGNYSPATLQEALNRGLTPCEKCFN